MADNTTEIIYVDGEGLKHVVSGLEKQINDKESWKEWSEENESSGDEKDVYIGERNSVSNELPSEFTPREDTEYRAKSYSFGKDNVTNASTSFNTTPANDAPTAVHIGNTNIINGEGVVVGKKNTASEFGIAIGESNTATDGSVALGAQAESHTGSFVFNGRYRKASATYNSFALSVGGNIEATIGSFAVGTQWSNQVHNGSIGLGSAINANHGSIVLALGSYNNISDNGGILLGRDGLTANNAGISIGISSVSSTEGGISIGAYNIKTSWGGTAIGRQGVEASSGAIALGRETVTADTGAIALGRYNVTATGGALSMGIGGNKATGAAIAIGMNDNYAEDGAISLGRSCYAKSASIAIGENKLADGSSISIGMIPSAYANTKGKAFIYYTSSYSSKYVVSVKFKEPSVVTGTWSGNVFTESSTGRSKAIKTDAGNYYSSYSSVPLDELTITHIDGSRSSGQLVPYGTPIGQVSKTYSYSHTPNWITITSTERSYLHYEELFKNLTYHSANGRSISIGGSAYAAGGSIAMYAGLHEPYTVSLNRSYVNGMYVPSDLTVDDNTCLTTYAYGDSTAIGHKTYALNESLAMNTYARAENASICIGAGGSGLSEASNASTVIGVHSIATYGSLVLGRESNGSNNAIILGNNSTGSLGGIIIGDNNNCSGWTFIGGWKNTAAGYGHALIFGANNYSYTFEPSYMTGTTTIDPFSLITGFGNQSYGRFNLVHGLENVAGNSTVNKDEYNNVFRGITAIGTSNIADLGSFAFAYGEGNKSTGHHASSFGLLLTANEHQLVVGKYNKELSGTKRYSTTEDKYLTPVDVTTGAAFVVGNGYAEPGEVSSSTYVPYDWRDETHIHRSNAMVVWQNGDVEATDFILKYKGKKYRLTDILDAIGVDLSNVEEVINDN